MRNYLKCITGMLLVTTSCSAFALTLESESFNNNQIIPYKYVYCQPKNGGGVTEGESISPELHWSQIPKGTKSFALLVSDNDVAKVSYFDSPDRMIKLNEPRITMYHWVIANIPVNLSHLPEGAGAKGFKRGGFKPGQTPHGTMGLNLYNVSMNLPISKRITFRKNIGRRMNGIYGRYGGMCAPFNDELIYSYVFKLYALDVEKLDLPKNGDFTGDDLLTAIQGHVIESGQLVAKSITNPDYLK